MKTFTKFKQDALSEAFITKAEALTAYRKGIEDGSIRVCEACGSPNLAEVQKFGMSCVDCGIQTEGIVPVDEDEIEEEAPTNNAGSGNIAGIGVGPQGEPGVAPIHQRKTGKLKLMNGPAVDPRMFADKIFKRKPV